MFPIYSLDIAVMWPNNIVIARVEASSDPSATKKNWRTRTQCNATHVHARALRTCMHARTHTHAHTHARTHASARERTHACTHAHVTPLGSLIVASHSLGLGLYSYGLGLGLYSYGLGLGLYSYGLGLGLYSYGLGLGLYSYGLGLGG